MRIAIIGTGFSGLCMGIALRQAGFDDFSLFEKTDGIGGTWRLVLADGTEEAFDVLVTGVGQLSRPHIPDFPGLSRFRGPCFHSARWDHDVDLKDRDVGVIGNAASAVQFVPQIAPTARHLTVFQRSANWMMPKNDREYSETEKRLAARFPLLGRLYRFQIWLMTELVLYPMMGRSRLYKWWGRRQTEKSLRQAIHDPDLRRKLVPDYPFGAKRILFSDDYYEALDRDDVSLVTESIMEITNRSVRTADGTEHIADVLILATGFRTNPFLAPIEITGRAGRSLHEVWHDGAEAYLGITVAGFPNLFMTYGPNTNLGHTSIIIMIECQVRYIMECLQLMCRKGVISVDVREDVQRDYNEMLQRRLRRKAWSAVGSSWYMQAGRITNNWTGNTPEYWWRTRHFDARNYRMVV